ncbi:MAG: hypothetical protein ACK58J_14080, partial [Planctomyces sp.]
TGRRPPRRARFPPTNPPRPARPGDIENPQLPICRQQTRLLPTDRQLVIFNESGTVWSDWIRRWETGAQGLPQACLQAPGIVLLLPAGSN